MALDEAGRQMAFDHFQKMGVETFRSEYVRTRGFYGQPEFQHFAPEWIESLNQQRERQRAEAAENDRKQQEDRHRESSEQGARQHQQQLAHDRRLYRRTQLVALAAFVVSLGSAGFSAWSHWHPIAVAPVSVAPEPQMSPTPNSPQLSPLSAPSATNQGDVAQPTPTSQTTPEPLPAPPSTQ